MALKILFAHRFLPGRFGALATALAARGDACVFLHAEGTDAPAGVRGVRFQPTRPLDLGDDSRMRPLETAVLDGEAAFHAARGLAAEGFRPDVIVAQGGFGPGLHLAEAFRGVPVLGAFEWFEAGPAMRAQLRLELAACRRGMVESAFQLEGFPAEFRPKLEIVHAGIDTGLWAPSRGRAALRAELGVPRDGELLVHCGPIFQAHRGCDTMLAALALLLARRPALQVCLVGERSGLYAAPPAGNEERRAAMRAALASLDRSRLRVATGSTAEFRLAALQASDVVINLADGFPVSHSLLEAMACAVPVVGSDTPPVREFIEDGATGVLAPFADPAAVAGAVERVLDDRDLGAGLGRAARRQVVLRNGLARQVARKIELVEELAGARG